MIWITVEYDPTYEFKWIVRDAISVADRLQVGVKFVLGEATIRVSPGDNATSVINQLNRHQGHQVRGVT